MLDFFLKIGAHQYVDVVAVEWVVISACLSFIYFLLTVSVRLTYHLSAFAFSEVPQFWASNRDVPFRFRLSASRTTSLATTMTAPASSRYRSGWEWSQCWCYWSSCCLALQCCSASTRWIVTTTRKEKQSLSMLPTKLCVSFWLVTVSLCIPVHCDHRQLVCQNRHFLCTMWVVVSRLGCLG